ncbi:MAG: nucleoside triphosphate pyrophosphohydrolase [Porticoccaceae bacterium]|jgi:ATP diphosphatase|nr:nucleoside triphosphate pyrophosphohydrolase [Porticoccaceae bacterium]
MNHNQKTEYGIEDLRYLMRRLRDPQSGCPWDLKQNFQSLTSHTIEEAYEVVDAIEQDDMSHLSEELGDLLFQIIFYSQLAEEQSQFSFDDIISTITQKLIRRHPHVFPEGTIESSRVSLADAEIVEIKRVWEEIKRQERTDKGVGKTLDDIPLALPALNRALKLQKRAANVGFDWSDIKPVIEKINEEVIELEVEIKRGDKVGMADELGDLLFSCVNLARHLKLDPETSLRGANQKFKRRFESMELLAGKTKIEDHSADQLELLWGKVKRSESHSS